MKKDNHPLTDTIGQLPHQTVHTKYGDVVDQDELVSDIVDSDGMPVISEDELALKNYVKEAISVDNFIETFTTNAHETLIKLLALQDNAHPLKKGGINIAYRTNALITHCRMEFSAEENVVFDAILGMMSSFPEEKCYKIEPTSFLKYSRYSNPKYLYTVFKKGTKKLRERTLIFENLGPNGEDDVSVPWFDVLRYHKGTGYNKDESAYIEFAPSEFFKDLALCSQLVHGAYGALEVTTQLQGKYSIALYWMLESKKKYREYPGATPGVFRMSIEELRHQFSIPPKYSAADIKRRVLDPSMKSINAVAECDFYFDYEVIKVNGSPAVAGYQFEVKAKNYIESEKTPQIEQVEDEFFIKIKMFLETSGIEFSDSDIKKVCSQAKRCNKDAMYMMQIILAFKKRLDDDTLEPVEDKLSYLCKMIELGTSDNVTKPKKAKKKTDNDFNNFKQNDYDFDELEKQIVDN